jgi:hypothetical protein
MPALIHLQCLDCRKVAASSPVAAAAARCSACGGALCAVGKLEQARSRSIAASIPVASPAAAPDGQRVRVRGGGWILPASLGLAVVGLLVIGGEVGYLEAGRRADTERGANQAVLEKVQAARTLLAARRFEQAQELLQAALATPAATDLAEANRLQVEVRRARLASLLAAATDAARQRNPARARALLETYFADPSVPRTGSVADQASDLDLATSDTRATDRLHQLSDEGLAAYARGGSLPAPERMATEPLRDVYAATLRAQLAPEQQRRAQLRRAQTEAERAARAEQDRRATLIRATPAFHDLQNFVAGVRKSRARSSADPRVLAYLFRELNIANQDEQARTLTELTGPSQTTDSLRQSIGRQRLDLKDRFRAYSGFDRTDRETFDRLADEELDRLFLELGSPDASKGEAGA